MTDKFKTLLTSFLFFTQIMWVSSFCYADSTELKVGMNTSWGEPLVFFKENEAPKKGIIIELAQAILKEAKINHSWVILPRNRTEEKFLNGEIDLRVFLNPTWTSKPEEHEWSDVIFEDKNVVVQASKKNKVKNYEAIKGKKMGAVLGYYYPQLDAFFNSGDLVRVNAETQNALLMMLDNQKIEYGVTSIFAAKYFLKKKSKNKLLGLSQIDVSVYPIHIAARKGETETIKKINAAIAKLKKSKKIDHILKKYQ